MNGDFTDAFRYLVPVLAFAGGIYISEVIRGIYREYGKLHWRQIVVVLEILLLFVVGFLPQSMNMAANILVSFVCAMQVEAFRKMKGSAYASTMCIGNLRSATEMLYRYRHAVNISRTDRYRVFNMGEIRTFSVKLTGLEPGKYCLRLYKVTKEHGSSYDAWVRMGAPERMNRMERAMLCHSADPEYRVWEQETDPEGSLTVQERLEPHETALIEVEQIL